MEYDYILIFSNTHNAINCEKVLINYNIDVTVLPTPSNISNSCGISIGIYKNDFDKVKKFILNKNISIKFIYDIKNNSILNSF